MSKINVKESILEIVKKNNLEILKIDLINDDESFARLYGGERSESCKVYTTLESLDFEVVLSLCRRRLKVQCIAEIKTRRNQYG